MQHLFVSEQRRHQFLRSITTINMMLGWFDIKQHVLIVIVGISFYFYLNWFLIYRAFPLISAKLGLYTH